MTPAGIEPVTVRFVAQHIDYRATAEACSTQVKATFRIKVDLYCTGLNKCGLFSNKHNGVIAIGTEVF
jgi:hypothetical protein